MCGWMEYGWMECGWMECGWMRVWMEVCMDECVYVDVCVFLYLNHFAVQKKLMHCKSTILQ